MSLSFSGRTAGIFTAFPLNSTGEEVDGWMDGWMRGVGMGQQRIAESEEARGQLVLPLVSSMPRS